MRRMGHPELWQDMSSRYKDVGCTRCMGYRWPVGNTLCMVWDIIIIREVVKSVARVSMVKIVRHLRFIGGWMIVRAGSGIQPIWQFFHNAKDIL